jgi:hypothetical protein
MKSYSDPKATSFDCYDAGISYEDRSIPILQQACGTPGKRNETNDNFPDWEWDPDAVEIKLRNGTYKTTSNHVLNGMISKFYQGVWVPRLSRRSRRLNYYFKPFLDGQGNFIIKPEYRSKTLYTIMSDIKNHPPTQSAMQLLQKAGIKLATRGICEN